MTHDIVLVAVAAGVTMATRFLPFLIFRKQVPQSVRRLGAVLPCAIMGMLVVYCLKDVTPLAWPYGIPELLSCVLVAVLHIWKRNSLLSIGGGTLFYMLLVQLVF